MWNLSEPIRDQHTQKIWERVTVDTEPLSDIMIYGHSKCQLVKNPLQSDISLTHRLCKCDVVCNNQANATSEVLQLKIGKLVLQKPTLVVGHSSLERKFVSFVVHF